MFDVKIPIYDAFDYPYVYIKFLNENARMPTRAKEGDAGLDLYAAEDVFIPVGVTALVSLGIATEIPLNTMLKIEDRSSMAIKGLRTGAGIVDSGYRGEIKVVMHNLTCVEDTDPVLFKKGKQIKKGDKIAQAILHPILLPIPNKTEELKDTSRGTGGFGIS